MIHFTATASHSSREWVTKLETARFLVRKDSGLGTFYATAFGFGCGKNFATPEEAVTDMLVASGYYNITITRSI